MQKVIELQYSSGMKISFEFVKRIFPKSSTVNGDIRGSSPTLLSHLMETLNPLLQIRLTKETVIR